MQEPQLCNFFEMCQRIGLSFYSKFFTLNNEDKMYYNLVFNSDQFHKEFNKWESELQLSDMVDICYQWNVFSELKYKSRVIKLIIKSLDGMEEYRKIFKIK